MLALENIVVVLEPGRAEQPVWSAALLWAKATGAQLHVFLPVAGDVPQGLALSTGLQQVAAHTAELEGERWIESWLKDAPAGTDHTVVSAPKWCEAVLHEARRQEADLLLVAHESAETKVVQALLRQLPCPLYLVKNGQAPRCLGGAVGAVAEDTPHKLLNTVVLEHLSGYAALWQAEARVLSALPNPAELVPLMGDAYAVSYAGNELDNVYRKALVEQAELFGLHQEAIIAQVGRPDMVIPLMVKEQGIDCLLLGTVARQALAAFWLGNTAEDVLPRVDCDVLVLRPQDYFDPS